MRSGIGLVTNGDAERLVMGGPVAVPGLMPGPCTRSRFTSHRWPFHHETAACAQTGPHLQYEAAGLVVDDDGARQIPAKPGQVLQRERSLRAVSRMCRKL